MNAKRLMGAAAATAMALGLAACAGGGAGSTTDESAGPADTSAATGDVLVGVAMPTETSERWIADGNAVEAGLQDLGSYNFV